MHSFLFSLPLVVFRSRRAVFYPLIFLKSQILEMSYEERNKYVGFFSCQCERLWG
jgi:hypothetical protein